MTGRESDTGALINKRGFSHLEAVREVHRSSTEMFGIVLMRLCYRDRH